MKSIAAFLCRGARSLAVILIFAGVAYSADEEQVTFYPTYGYEDGDNWVIPMRIWVHERHRLADVVVNEIATDMGDIHPEEMNNFRSRIQDFVADSESHEEVTFEFDNDPEDQEYRVRNSRGNFPKTDNNGLIEGTIKIPRTQAQELLRRQGSRDGWLTFRATSESHAGIGRVRLIEPTGLSIISDIDDTIKITELPAGARIVVRNTFFRNFVGAPEMAATYRQWSEAAFHYVSGGPWQLYGPLSEFLFNEGGFPEGTFHMKSARKNLLNPDTWNDLKQLVANENHTFDLKVAHIGEIMKRFPTRMFVLIGDSGEKDPEVYRRIKSRFPGQVQEIRIRDVVNDKEKNPGRLKGMTIIQAATVKKGVSQFHN